VGFFDPAYKKLLAKCPASFQQSSEIWLILIDEAITKHKAIVSADLFKVAVLSHLAIDASNQDPSSWSEDGLAKVKLSLHSAHQLLSSNLQQAAFDTANTLRHVGS
jgi:hypothetical protein